MSMAGPVPHYTAEEVRHFPDDRVRYEVVRGELLVTPAPGTVHQRLVGDFYFRLREYVDRHDLGEVVVSPYEVEFADDTAVQPDLLVLLHGGQHRLHGQRLYGPPALVIEIVSYTSKRTDRLQKRRLYQEERVAEYWIVDPELRRVERWTPASDAPQLVDGVLRWQPGPARALEISLPQCFTRAWRDLEDDSPGAR